jgi:hypothetical protein
MKLRIENFLTKKTNKLIGIALDGINQGRWIILPTLPSICIENGEYSSLLYRYNQDRCRMFSANKCKRKLWQFILIMNSDQFFLPGMIS